MRQSIQGKFYRFKFGRALVLKDELHKLTEQQAEALNAELDASWGPLLAV